MTDARPKPNQSAIAKAAWNDDPPDWIVELARQCDEVGQPTVAARIGMSVSVVNETLRNKYKGRLDRVSERVAGAFLGKTVSCPVLGDDLARDACLEKQTLPFAATNPERVRLFRTCPSCPNYRGPRKAASASKPEE